MREKCNVWIIEGKWLWNEGEREREQERGWIEKEEINDRRNTWRVEKYLKSEIKQKGKNKHCKKNEEKENDL